MKERINWQSRHVRNSNHNDTDHNNTDHNNTDVAEYKKANGENSDHENANIIRSSLLAYAQSIEIDAMASIDLGSLQALTLQADHQLKARAQLFAWMPEAKTAIVILLSYNQADNEQLANDSMRGRLCKASWGQDYHRVIREKLSLIADYLVGNINAAAINQIAVDTAPINDRQMAVWAGLGQYGYNSNIIHPKLGSYVFIGTLLTNIVLTDAIIAEQEPNFYAGCDSCQKCMRSCPTGALLAPAKLDKNKCLAYLTLSKAATNTAITTNTATTTNTLIAANHNDDSWTEQLANQIYGCDICQEACPVNKKAPTTKHRQFVESEDIRYPVLSEVLSLSKSKFRAKYGHLSGAWRGHQPWRRNAQALLNNRCQTTTLDNKE